MSDPETSAMVPGIVWHEFKPQLEGLAQNQNQFFIALLFKLKNTNNLMKTIKINQNKYWREVAQLSLSQNTQPLSHAPCLIVHKHCN